MATPTPMDVALVPIADALPELSADDYADVRQWDAEILAADTAHEAYTGERLAKIRDKLTQGPNLGSGMWTRYLAARGLNERTARHRIQLADGRYSKSTAANFAASRLLPEVEELQGKYERLQVDYQGINHQLAAANGAIQRLKASGKTDPGPGPGPEHGASGRVSWYGDLYDGIMRQLYAHARAEEGYTGTFEEYCREEEAKRKAEDAEKAKARKEAAKEAAKLRRQPEEKARHAAAVAAYFREDHIRNIELGAGILLDHLGEMLGEADLYTEEQCQRVATLAPELRALADRMATALQRGEEQSA